MNPEVSDPELATEVEVSPRYVRDYVTGEQVRATPEEVEGVQVFAQRLVEDYGYPKALMQTRPQHRVRRSPSDEKRSYPVDIAVFSEATRLEDQLRLIVECKRLDRRKGIEQLKLYMDMSSAEYGVWFNGEDHHYLRKVVRADGTRLFEDLPNIPRYGQRVEDLGLFRRRDLVRPSNLKVVFRDLRNHLAGHVTGITRDEPLAQEIINVLFCKIYDELNTAKDDIVTFRSGHNEVPAEVSKRITDLFERVKLEYSDVFNESDVIILDDASLVYVVGELQNYCVTDADRDAIGDAFEVFIGPALRGSEGQFFTPRNVVQLAVDLVSPKPNEMVIDPACGSGGFLIAALEHVWTQIEAQSEAMGWSAVQVDRKKRDAASRGFRGLDKDRFLARVTKAYMAIVGDGRGGVFCENSLLPPQTWEDATQNKIGLGKFDVVLTNPPFGAQIKITGDDVLSQFQLGHKWKSSGETGTYEPTKTLHQDQPPQILFIERCLQLLKPGGRMGIVLPESVFGMPTYNYVLSYLRAHTRIRGVISMPEDLFKTSGKGGTHAKVCLVLIHKKPPEKSDYEIFMANAQWCGHDSRGNLTLRQLEDGTTVLLDDVPLIGQRFLDLFGTPENFWASD